MSKLEFTHLDKVFFPQAKITKGDLIEYYQAVAPTMLPYLKDRPHSLLRQPDGIKGEGFFQKDMDHTPPGWLKTVKIRAESTGQDVHYLVVDSADALLYQVQLGCIEINPWNSRLGRLDKPDWLVIDLDPEAIGFGRVVETAQAVKTVTDELKIPAYPKTSGKTGIHIFIPLGAKYTYKQARVVAKSLVGLVHDRAQSFTSLERQPKQRQGKVYLDWLQNGEGQTLAAPYSVRPTPAASVSTPLHWDEVNGRLDPAKFTIKTAAKRLAAVGDLWKPVLGKGVDIKKTLAKLE